MLDHQIDVLAASLAPSGGLQASLAGAKSRPMNVESSSAIKIVLAGMIGIATAMGIGRFVFTPILPGMMDALSLSAFEAGLSAAEPQTVRS